MQIVMPIDFIIALVLGGIGVILLIIINIAGYIRDAIRKRKNKK